MSTQENPQIPPPKGENLPVEPDLGATGGALLPVISTAAGTFDRGTGDTVTEGPTAASAVEMPQPESVKNEPPAIVSEDEINNLGLSEYSYRDARKAYNQMRDIVWGMTLDGSGFTSANDNGIREQLRTIDNHLTQWAGEATDNNVRAMHARLAREEFDKLRELALNLREERMAWNSGQSQPGTPADTLDEIPADAWKRNPPKRPKLPTETDITGFRFPDRTKITHKPTRRIIAIGNFEQLDRMVGNIILPDREFDGGDELDTIHDARRDFAKATEEWLFAKDGTEEVKADTSEAKADTTPEAAAQKAFEKLRNALIALRDRKAKWLAEQGIADKPGEDNEPVITDAPDTKAQNENVASQSQNHDLPGPDSEANLQTEPPIVEEESFDENDEDDIDTEDEPNGGTASDHREIEDNTEETDSGPDNSMTFEPDDETPITATATALEEAIATFEAGGMEVSPEQIELQEQIPTLSDELQKPPTLPESPGALEADNDEDDSETTDDEGEEEDPIGTSITDDTLTLEPTRELPAAQPTTKAMVAAVTNFAAEPPEGTPEIPTPPAEPPEPPEPPGLPEADSDDNGDELLGSSIDEIKRDLETAAIEGKYVLLKTLVHHLSKPNTPDLEPILQVIEDAYKLVPKSDRPADIQVMDWPKDISIERYGSIAAPLRELLTDKTNREIFAQHGILHRRLQQILASSYEQQKGNGDFGIAADPAIVGDKLALCTYLYLVATDRKADAANWGHTQSRIQALNIGEHDVAYDNNGIKTELRLTDPSLTEYIDFLTKGNLNNLAQTKARLVHQMVQQALYEAAISGETVNLPISQADLNIAFTPEELAHFYGLRADIVDTPNGLVINEAEFLITEKPDLHHPDESIHEVLRIPINDGRTVQWEINADNPLTVIASLNRIENPRDRAKVIEQVLADTSDDALVKRVEHLQEQLELVRRESEQEIKDSELSARRLVQRVLKELDNVDLDTETEDAKLRQRLYVIGSRNTVIKMAARLNVPPQHLLAVELGRLVNSEEFQPDLENVNYVNILTELYEEVSPEAVEAIRARNEDIREAFDANRRVGLSGDNTEALEFAYAAEGLWQEAVTAQLTVHGPGSFRRIFDQILHVEQIDPDSDRARKLEHVLLEPGVYFDTDLTDLPGPDNPPIDFVSREVTPGGQREVVLTPSELAAVQQVTHQVDEFYDEAIQIAIEMQLNNPDAQATMRRLENEAVNRQEDQSIKQILMLASECNRLHSTFEFQDYGMETRQQLVRHMMHLQQIPLKPEEIERVALYMGLDDEFMADIAQQEDRTLIRALVLERPDFAQAQDLAKEIVILGKNELLEQSKGKRPVATTEAEERGIEIAQAIINEAGTMPLIEHTIEQIQNSPIVEFVIKENGEYRIIRVKHNDFAHAAVVVGGLGDNTRGQVFRYLQEREIYRNHFNDQDVLRLRQLAEDERELREVPVIESALSAIGRDAPIGVTESSDNRQELERRARVFTRLDTVVYTALTSNVFEGRTPDNIGNQLHAEIASRRIWPLTGTPRQDYARYLFSLNQRARQSNEAQEVLNAITNQEPTPAHSRADLLFRVMPERTPPLLDQHVQAAYRPINELNRRIPHPEYLRETIGQALIIENTWGNVVDMLARELGGGIDAREEAYRILETPILELLARPLPANLETRVHNLLTNPQEITEDQFIFSGDEQERGGNFVRDYALNLQDVAVIRRARMNYQIEQARRMGETGTPLDNEQADFIQAYDAALDAELAMPEVQEEITEKRRIAGEIPRIPIREALITAETTHNINRFVLNEHLVLEVPLASRCVERAMAISPEIALRPEDQERIAVIMARRLNIEVQPDTTDEQLILNLVEKVRREGEDYPQINDIVLEVNILAAHQLGNMDLDAREVRDQAVQIVDGIVRDLLPRFDLPVVGNVGQRKPQTPAEANYANILDEVRAAFESPLQAIEHCETMLTKLDQEVDHDAFERGIENAVTRLWRNQLPERAEDEEFRADVRKKAGVILGREFKSPFIAEDIESLLNTTDREVMRGAAISAIHELELQRLAIRRQDEQYRLRRTYASYEAQVHLLLDFLKGLDTPTLETIEHRDPQIVLGEFEQLINEDRRKARTKKRPFQRDLKETPAMYRPADMLTNEMVLAFVTPPEENLDIYNNNVQRARGIILGNDALLSNPNLQTDDFGQRERINGVLKVTPIPEPILKHAIILAIGHLLKQRSKALEESNGASYEILTTQAKNLIRIFKNFD